MVNLLVNEIFGPTFQGEGRSVGRLCSFVRLGTCNLHCKWCDTAYTWAYDERHAAMHNSGIKYDPKVELTRMTIDEVVGALTDLTSEKVNPSLIIISGGEPMLQQEGIAKLVRALPFVEFEIETAGTREVEEVLIESFYIAGTYPRLRFNVSPKLEHSGNSIEERRVYPALKSLSRQSSVFKFVVTKGTWEDDVREIRGIQAYLTLPSERIYIMPEGTTRTGQIKSMEYFADRVVEQGWNLTPRLHTLIWGDERGK